MNRPWLWAVASLALATVLVLGWRSCSGTSGPGDETAAPGAGADSSSATGQPGGPAAGGADAAGAAQRKGPPKVIIAMTESGVRVRLERRPRIDVPGAPFAEKIPALQAASDAGDVVARYQLGLLLYQCRDVPTDGAGLSKAVEEIHQTRSRNGWDVSNPDDEEQVLRQTYAACTGVSADARGSFRDLLRSAADQGLMEAQLDLMYHLPRGKYCQYIEECTPEQAATMNKLREEARANVYKALAAGSAEALRTVGGWMLNEEMGNPDPVEAYAYFKAYDEIQRISGRERELTTMLSGIRSRLRPVDLQRADDRARELLSNPKCCLMTK